MSAVMICYVMVLETGLKCEIGIFDFYPNLDARCRCTNPPPTQTTDVHWTLNYLLKLESKWNISEIYNLMKHGLLVFHGEHEKGNQKEFHRYLIII